MWDYTNGVISLIFNFTNDVPRFRCESVRFTLECIQQTNLTSTIEWSNFAHILKFSIIWFLACNLTTHLLWIPFKICSHFTINHLISPLVGLNQSGRFVWKLFRNQFLHSFLQLFQVKSSICLNSYRIRFPSIEPILMQRNPSFYFYCWRNTYRQMASSLTFLLSLL